ncbi:hypothetical protein [Psychrobacillus phage Perkons]|nr:hypothetical protein [Psychrobacillus phage Perkons]
MKFEVEKMETLIQSDKYLSFIFKDLSARNPMVEPISIIEIIYNSEVITGDYEQAYKKL